MRLHHINAYVCNERIHTYENLSLSILTFNFVYRFNWIVFYDERNETLYTHFFSRVGCSLFFFTHQDWEEYEDIINSEPLHPHHHNNIDLWLIDDDFFFLSQQFKINRSVSTLYNTPFYCHKGNIKCILQRNSLNKIYDFTGWH